MDKINQTVEIQGTGLEHTHNLEAGKRLAVEGDRDRISHPLQ